MNTDEKREMLAAIHELTPSHLHSFLETALNDEDADIDRAGLILTGELNPSKIAVQTSVIRRESSIWYAMQDEIYDFICTNSTDYREERTGAAHSIKGTISVLTASLAAQFHIAAGIATGIVTLVIIGMLKVTKNAWCKVHKAKREEASRQV